MTQLVGVVNITPDSFSDGGHYWDIEAAVNHVDAMLDEGVDVLDIGAESTRPNATPITADEEWLRLQPILAYTQERLRQLRRSEGRYIPISIDTRHASTAAHAVAAGVDWINDVTGFRDEAMLRAVQHSHVRLVVMHSLTVPANPLVKWPEDVDVLAEITAWQQATRRRLRAAGICSERIIWDVGLGFGKTTEQNWELLRRMPTLMQGAETGEAWLVGHSRKRFFEAVTPLPPQERDVETLSASLWLAQHGVDYVRVHQIPMHRRALAVLRQLESAATSRVTTCQ